MHGSETGGSPPLADPFLLTVSLPTEKKEAPIGSWMTKTEDEKEKNYMSDPDSNLEVEPLLKAVEIDAAEESKNADFTPLTLSKN